MRRTIVHLLVGMMALLTSLRPVVPMPAAAAPAMPHDMGVYEEDFATYTYKGYAENTEWNIWNGHLTVSMLDAIWQENPAVAVSRNGDTIIVWEDHRCGGTDIYAQRLDAAGNRLWAADVRVNSEGSTLLSLHPPAVAVSGNGDVVVVWAGWRNWKWGIYAQRVDTGGHRLWPVDVRVSADSGTAYQSDPAVAVDGSGNAIVVWEDDRNADDDVDIYAQRLDTGGGKLWAADVRVNSDSAMLSQSDPAVAADGSGNVIAVWEDKRNGDDDADIYAQRLDAAGNKLWSTDLRVNSGSDTASQSNPAVAVDGGGNAFVVWQDRRDGGSDIYAQRLDTDGNRTWDTDLRVNSESAMASQVYPAVAMDGSSNAVVVWTDIPFNNIYAQRLDTAGNKLWIVDVRVNSENSDPFSLYPVRLAANGNGNAFVVWEDQRNGGYDIYAQRLDVVGNRLWITDLRVHVGCGAAVQEDPTVAVGRSGNAFVVWKDWRKGKTDVYAQRLDTAGNKLWTVDIQVNADHGAPYQYAPTAVALDGSGNVVVVWEDLGNGHHAIYAQRLDAHGNRMWSSDVRVSADSDVAYQDDPAVAVDENGSAIVVWDEGDICAQRLDADGNRLWPADVRVSTDSDEGYQHDPSVAGDRNGNAIVVWGESRSGEDAAEVYAQRLDTDGNRLWAADIRVNSDAGIPEPYSRAAVAVSENGDAVVVWEDERNGDDDIYAQRLDPTGNRLWTADLRVNSDSGGAYESDPAVAVDGDGNAIVVWENWNIYAQRLDAAGNKLWAIDVRANSSSGTVWPDPAVGVDGSGHAVVVWEDHRNSNADIYAQWLDTNGQRLLPDDTQLVHPDSFYFPSGTVESGTVNQTHSDITEATLTTEYQTNGGTVQFYLTNDGGTHWAEVTPGVAHAFTTTGSDLRWRAVLTTDPVWLRTPVVNSLRIEYSTQGPHADDYEPDDTCAQASPLQVNGAVQAHTFHQPDDEDWAWFDVVAGTTYVLQTAHAGPNADTVLELHDVCNHPIMTDTNAFGHDARLVFPASSDSTLYARVTNLDGGVYGEGTNYDLSVRTYHPNGLAVVVAGHNDTWQLQPNIDYAADQAYLTLLREAGFPKANVHYLGPDPDRDVDGNGHNDDIAATATITNVRYAIQDWPREQGLALGVPFYVYLMDHGHYDQFLANGNAEKVTAPLLDLWLSNLEATTGADQITVVIDACKSGSFIDVTGAGPAEISGHNRVIVASTTSQANAYPSERGALFSDVFWTALGDNQDVWSAYRTAKAAVDARGLMQTPWLDDNGDAVANEEDGDLARGRGLAGVFAGSEPVIDWLTVGEIGASGTATVAAQVRGDFKVTGVHVEVYPPGYEEPEGGPGETPVVGVPTTTLTLTGDDVYVATLTGLTAPGSYRVVGYAVDDEGNWALPRWIVMEGQGEAYQKVYLPLVLR